MRDIAATIQEVMLAKFNAPLRDRYQVRLFISSSVWSIMRPLPPSNDVSSAFELANSHQLILIFFLQMITQHSPSEFISKDTNTPNLPQNDHLIFIQIFQQGRTAQQKQATYAVFTDRLGKELGLREGD